MTELGYGIAPLIPIITEIIRRMVPGKGLPVHPTGGPELGSNWDRYMWEFKDLMRKTDLSTIYKTIRKMLDGLSGGSTTDLGSIIFPLAGTTEATARGAYRLAFKGALEGVTYGYQDPTDRTSFVSTPDTLRLYRRSVLPDPYWEQDEWYVYNAHYGLNSGLTIQRYETYGWYVRGTFLIRDENVTSPGQITIHLFQTTNLTTSGSSLPNYLKGDHYVVPDRSEQLQILASKDIIFRPVLTSDGRSDVQVLPFEFFVLDYQKWDFRMPGNYPAALPKYHKRYYVALKMKRIPYGTSGVPWLMDGEFESLLYGVTQPYDSADGD